MTTAITCPGCGLVSDEAGVEPDRPVWASAACWGLHAELAGFELLHMAQLGRFHQLTVDAYGGQHPDPEGTGLRLAYSLMGLCLALERGWTGVQVRDLHARMGRRQPWWPAFRRPAAWAKAGAPEPTVADVVLAGARSDAVEGHAEAVQAWARGVWEGWSPEHATIRAFTDRVLTARR